MTNRLHENLERLAAEAGITEITPEIRMFAWLINQDSLIGFWEAAQQYAKFAQKEVDSYLKGKT